MKKEVKWNYEKGYKVYYNLNKKTYSILAWNIDKKGWRLKCYCDNPLLRTVEFKVSEKLRQRVIKEKRKNVHAYATARNFEDCDLIHKDNWFKKWIKDNFKREATYNPYLYDSFVFTDDKSKIKKCEEAFLFKGKLKIKQ
tara:strand:- start:737 stop:1156 length:420 start_codon:yes stop_codon:yes gene_type:complete